MKSRFSQQSLAQQIGLIASVFCFLVSITLVGLSATSSEHMQTVQRQDHGQALARHISRDVSTALEAGDLLGVAALLQRFVDNSAAVQVIMYDLDNKALAQAGPNIADDISYFRAAVSIGSDTAGEVVVALDTSADSSNRFRFTLSLVGLSVLLSLAVFMLVKRIGQYHSNQLKNAYHQIALSDTPLPARDKNEWQLLKNGLDALPLDLLRARQAQGHTEEHYQQTAVLYLQLDSLANYVDTLDDTALQHYIRQLHQIVFGAAGFYQGELQVVRQFGLAVFFTGTNKAGSAAFRATSCAWLVQELGREYSSKSPLGMKLFMAISVSDTGTGSDHDIYPGLYTQHVIDDLQQLCSNRPPRVLLTESAQADADIAGRVSTMETDLGDEVMLDSFESPYDDLLERQLRLVWQRSLSASKQQ